MCVLARRVREATRGGRWERRRRRRTRERDAGAAGDVGSGAMRPEAMQRAEVGAIGMLERAQGAAALGGRGADAERDGDDITERFRRVALEWVGGGGLLVESIGRCPVREIAQRGTEIVAVVGGGEPGELRKTVQTDVRRGLGGWALHRGLSRRGGGTDE